jgi:hypothetical protein
VDALAIAVAGGVLLLIVGSGLKSLARFAARAMRHEFADAVEAVTAPKFSALDAKFDAVQSQNAKDHGEVVKRLEDVEHRLAAVEVAVATQTKRED